MKTTMYPGHEAVEVSLFEPLTGPPEVVINTNPAKLAAPRTMIYLRAEDARRLAAVLVACAEAAERQKWTQ